jgi:predicted ATP-dependent Lon-type protease
MNISITNGQKRAIDLIKNGHNVCVTGQAGTGKTYVGKLVSAWNNSTVLCTTGLACMQYDAAFTVHR